MAAAVAPSKGRLLAMTPASYIGKAAELARLDKALAAAYDIVDRVSIGASFNLVDVVNLKVDKVDLNGTAAYLISERVATTDQLKMWVSADGASNLLKLQSAGTSPVDLTFSEWNAVAPFSAPPADQIVTT